MALSPMQRKPFLNRSEARTLDLLERSLYGTGWQVYAKVRLSDVLAPGERENPDGRESRMLRMGHLDFVVVNRAEGSAPAFAVEFDGPVHADPDVRQRDQLKDRLCADAGLPVLRIGSDVIGEREQTTILEWVVDRFLAYRSEYPRIKRWCEAEVAELEALAEGRAGGTDDDAAVASWTLEGPTLDPDFLFDLRYPFPALAAVVERLFRRFGIVSIPEPKWGVRPLAPTESANPVLVRGAPSPSPEEHRAEATLIRRGDDPTYEVLHRSDGRVELSRQARDEPSLNQASRVRGLIESTLGTGVWSIGDSLADYLALAGIERWAGANLESSRLG
jgi:Protein of unknown function (DUF2726)